MFISIELGSTGLSGTSLVMAVLCAIVAHSKNRNAIIWGILGLCFSCFALIFCLMLDDPTERQEEEEKVRQRRRRDRERNLQARQRQTEFESRVEQRLAAHDRALGVDTSGATPYSGEVVDEDDYPVWFYEDRGSTAGPISKSALRVLISSGTLARSALVWTEGMLDWAPVDEALPELC